MQAKELKVESILSESNTYKIPKYQRPYSWQKNHVDALLEDLSQAFLNKEKEYFLGSIILIENTSEKYNEVIDGQQRLTTLCLMFSAFRDLMTSDRQKEHVEKRFLPRNALTGATGSARLTVREKDHWAFEKVLNNEALNKDELSDSQLNFLENKEYLVSALKEKANGDENYIANFADYVETCVWFVWVSAGNLASALRLFNVLNARGLPLSNADLIKSTLFELIGSDGKKQDLMDSEWAELEDIVGTDDLDNFLGLYRTSHMANKADSSLEEEYRKLMKLIAIPPLDFISLLIKAAKNREKILKNGLTTSIKSRQSLASLLRVDYDEWLPPLLAFLDNNANHKHTDEFCVLLEKITYQNWIRRLGRTQRNTIYYQLIKKIRSSGNFDELLKIFKSAENNKELVAFLDAEVYRTPYIKAVLLRLEDAAQDDSVMKTYEQRMSVEHILPKKFTDPYWTTRFSSEEHKDNLNRLGNLTLLSGSKNSAAQFSCFDKKKDVYLKKNGKVSFEMTKEVCEETQWRPQELAKRQDRLLELAKKLWVI